MTLQNGRSELLAIKSDIEIMNDVQREVWSRLHGTSTPAKINLFNFAVNMMEITLRF